MSLFNPDIDKPITTSPKFGLYSPKIINVNNKHSGIHLFNSNYILDNENVNKLPVGLYGELRLS